MSSAVVSFDLDGVLAEPPFGWNPAINRDVSMQPASEQTSIRQSESRDRLGKILTHTWYRFRYVLRPPRPGALEAVRIAAQAHPVIVLTGRHEHGRRQTQAWLEQHGFGQFVDDLIMNESRYSSARYKEAVLRARQVVVHVDDDAATAALLARNGIAVALLDWPRNRGLEFPPGVVRHADMHECSDWLGRRETAGDQP